MIFVQHLQHCGQLDWERIPILPCILRIRRSAGGRKLERVLCRAWSVGQRWQARSWTYAAVSLMARFLAAHCCDELRRGAVVHLNRDDSTRRAGVILREPRLVIASVGVGGGTFRTDWHNELASICAP